MSLLTFSINNKPIENKTNSDAKPSCGEEKIMSHKTELSKKINGTWTIAEIIEAMKAICPEAWIDESK